MPDARVQRRRASQGKEQGEEARRLKSQKKLSGCFETEREKLDDRIRSCRRLRRCKVVSGEAWLINSLLRQCAWLVPFSQTSSYSENLVAYTGHWCTSVPFGAKKRGKKTLTILKKVVSEWKT